jgi:hypothetical protein
VKLSGGPWGGAHLTGGFLDDKGGTWMPCVVICLSFAGLSVQVFCGSLPVLLDVNKKILCSPL